jgi:hypothetical protein
MVTTRLITTVAYIPSIIAATALDEVVILNICPLRIEKLLFHTRTHTKSHSRLQIDMPRNEGKLLV